MALGDLFAAYAALHQVIEHMPAACPRRALLVQARELLGEFIRLEREQGERASGCAPLAPR